MKTTSDPVIPRNEEQQEAAEWDYNQKRILKNRLEESHTSFARYFMKKMDSTKFILSDHHKVMSQTLQRVFDGEIKRLIINVPPGFTKTELAVKFFISRGLALNPASKYIHLSYADALALLNSVGIRDIVTHPDYGSLWPTEIRVDAKSKKIWTTKAGGGMLAVAAGGSVTGFRAGRMDKEKFTGAMIIDDPIKPDDAFSETIRNGINRRFTNTFASRLAHEEVPIIVIMQRIHEDDPTGFLLKGGTGELWHHLCLPVEIPEEDDQKDYPKEYTHGIPIAHNLPPGPIWPFKKNKEEIATMRTSDPYTCASQYDQDPVPLGGGMFKEAWWKYYVPNTIIPEYRFITGDTASKIKEVNDYSVFQCWGYKEGNIYLLDQIRGKWEAPELRMNAKAFWIKHYGTGAAATTNRLREMKIEDKASGTGLIQDLARSTKPPIPVTAIQRSTDKVQRANDVIPFIASGRVYLPTEAEWLSDYLDEFRKFTAVMTHKHDDQIDPTMDAIDHALGASDNEGGTW